MRPMFKRTNDILIEKVRRNSDEAQIAHFHPYYEIGYLLSGNRQMTIDHSIFSMEKGDIVIVNKEAVHKGSMSTKEGDMLEWIGLYFDERYLEPFVNVQGHVISDSLASGVIRIPAGRKEYIEELLNKMIYEYGKIDDMSDILLNSYFQELIGFLIRCRRGIGNETTKLNPDDELIAEAAEYIYKNYQKDITLDMLSKKYSMSKSHFSKRFKLVTGCGFKEYLISVRLKEACRRIIDTKDSITEIALDCGFSDSNYFGDAFRKVKGVSPNQYRKNRGMI